jgi:hypothetical protein
LSFVTFTYLHDYKLGNLNSGCEIRHWNLYSMKFYEQWHHIQSHSSSMLDWPESIVERGTVAKFWCRWGIRVNIHQVDLSHYKYPYFSSESMVRKTRITLNILFLFVWSFLFFFVLVCSCLFLLQFFIIKIPLKIKQE